MDISHVSEPVRASESRLKGSSFDKVDLSASRFEKVQLTGSSMREVDLSGLAVTRCDLRNATLNSCRIEGMTIDGIAVDALLASHAQLVGRAPGAVRPVRRMPRRWRKLVGTAATIAFVIVYALVAMALAQLRFTRGAPDVWQWLFYAIVGMGWILPLMPLIRWMERPDPGG